MNKLPDPGPDRGRPGMVPMNRRLASNLESDGSALMQRAARELHESRRTSASRKLETWEEECYFRAWRHCLARCYLKRAR